MDSLQIECFFCDKTEEFIIPPQKSYFKHFKTNSSKEYEEAKREIGLTMLKKHIIEEHPDKFIIKRTDV